MTKIVVKSSLYVLIDEVFDRFIANDFCDSRSLMSDSIEEDLKTERNARLSIKNDLLDDLEDDLISSRCCSSCLSFFDILS